MLRAPTQHQRGAPAPPSPPASGARRWRCAQPSRRCCPLAAMPSDGEAPPPGPSPLQVGVVGGLAGTALTAVAWLALGGPDSDASDAVAAAGPSAGDAAAALLWAVSLFFASPSQSLLLFLGRVDAERPSDASLRWLGTALRLPVDEPSYEPPPALVAANGLLYAAAGVAVAAALNAGLGGEATWGVSTGLGSCAAAFVYEVGRPQRLSAGQQVALQSEWSDFRAFADARLARTGRCHTSDVERAYRLHSPAYRRRRAAAGGEGAANAANDSDLRNFIANWHPGAERTSSGYIKGVSVLPQGSADSPSAAARLQPAASADASEAGG